MYSHHLPRCCSLSSMRCVQCGSLKDKVLDSRSSKDGTSIRRRRECLKCTYRYTTYEQIERTELRVVKRDGAREALNREKLMSGLIKACEKRPVPMDRLDRAVEEILTDLHKDHVERGALRHHRWQGDGQAPSDRSGRLRPLRLRLSPVRGRERVHRGNPIPFPSRRTRSVPAPFVQGLT